MHGVMGLSPIANTCKYRFSDDFLCIEPTRLWRRVIAQGQHIAEGDKTRNLIKIKTFISFKTAGDLTLKVGPIM